MKHTLYRCPGNVRKRLYSPQLFYEPTALFGTTEKLKNVLQTSVGSFEKYYNYRFASLVCRPMPDTLIIVVVIVRLFAAPCVPPEAKIARLCGRLYEKELRSFFHFCRYESLKFLTNNTLSATFAVENYTVRDVFGTSYLVNIHSVFTELNYEFRRLLEYRFLFRGGGNFI